MAKAKPEIRFWKYVDKNGPIPEHKPELGPCWIWKGTISFGYGLFHVREERLRAHKFSYELKRPIPVGLELDHLCRVRCCVNPEHLEAVTPRENVLRGIGPTARNARKTHCPSGHPYAGENLITRPFNGGRICRTCKRDEEHRRRRTVRDIAIKVRSWANNCAVYQAQCLAEKRVEAAEYHRGAKEAFERVAEALKTSPTAIPPKGASDAK